MSDAKRNKESATSVDNTATISQNYAILLVFKYHHYDYDSNIPGELYDMENDLHRAYWLAIERFNIPKSNITIITDIPPPQRNEKMDPWEPLQKVDEGFRLVRVHRRKPIRQTTSRNHPGSEFEPGPILENEYAPSIEVVIKELIRFMELTIHGIKSKGKTVPKIFFYTSMHGDLIPVNRKRSLLETVEEVSFVTKSDSDGQSAVSDKGDPNYDNALIFTNSTGTGRCYLYNKVIFDILFGRIPVKLDINSKGEKCGKISIPIVHRFGFSPKVIFDERLYTLSITPIPKMLYNHGIPPETNILAIFDTCHSASLSRFHYTYSPETRNMEFCELYQDTAEEFKDLNKLPICVSLSATSDYKEAPSIRGLGSPFTFQLYTGLTQCKTRLTISQAYDLITNTLPTSMKDCCPTISSTSNNSSSMIPFMEEMKEEVSMRANSPARSLIQFEKTKGDLKLFIRNLGRKTLTPDAKVIAIP